MKEFDPSEVFMNDFGRRLMGIGTKVNTDPLVTHCALMDDCICKKDGDCGNQQVCSRIEGYPEYPVCKDIRPRSEEDKRLHSDPLSVHGILNYLHYLVKAAFRA